VSAADGLPAISVVVATYNRAGALPGLIAAIEAQRDVAPIEIVVVDDGSSDGTPRVLDQLAATCSVALVPVVMAENGGPARARNAGWHMASAPLVAFTDDDCVPQPGWLAALASGLATADLVQGRTLPNPGQLERLGPFSRTVERVDESGWYETCNMGYRRDLLAALGGFDEGFRHTSYGEDIDLAHRGLDRGARSAFATDALVFHDVWPSDYRRHLREMSRREGVVRALRSHPGLRRRLHRRVFWKESHPQAMLAAAGIALALRPKSSAIMRLAALALVAPYVRYHTDVAPLPRSADEPPGVIAKALVGELVEIGVLARASLRYRTLLL
jgi:glycosyltransferase involved in cell wall biosynthesis